MQMATASLAFGRPFVILGSEAARGMRILNKMPRIPMTVFFNGKPLLHVSILACIWKIIATDRRMAARWGSCKLIDSYKVTACTLARGPSRQSAPRAPTTTAAIQPRHNTQHHAGMCNSAFWDMNINKHSVAPGPVKTHTGSNKTSKDKRRQTKTNKVK